jgi:SAM-dependent methyltransferase
MIYEYPVFFARFYDLIYEKMRSGTDSDFFLTEIKKTNGKVLEIGAGTGRFFTRALREGADIYGIDVSQPMIDILKQKLDKKEHDRISVQNILDFQLEETFDLIIAPFRVFMHILDKQEQIDALNHVYQYLNPGGRFIFDAFVPELSQLISRTDDQKDFDDEYMPGKRLKRFVNTKPDLINQLIQVTFKFQWDEDDGYQIRKWDVPLRFFFRYELEHLIERSAFEKQYKILGDYYGNDLGADSKDFIPICHKTR